MKKRVVYLPYPYYGDQRNQFAQNMVDLLKLDYDVVGHLEPVSNILTILETQAIILNWTEQNLSENWKEKILNYKKYGTRVIWFFHNKMAHIDKNREKVSENMLWLAEHCDSIVVLSQSSMQYIPGKEHNIEKVTYIPHIAYKNMANVRIQQYFKKNYDLKEEEFVYGIFGGIWPYKNIEMAIQCFKDLAIPNSKLIIAGKPISEEYKEEIMSLIKSSDNIFFESRFLVEAELDSIIAMTDVILMPYVDPSSMNSGVLIKAFSNGKTVIAPNICMVNDIDNENLFLYKWQIENIQTFKEQMIKAHSDGKKELLYKGEMAKRYIESNNCAEIVKKEMKRIIESSNILTKKMIENDMDITMLSDIYALSHESEQNNEKQLRYQYLFRTMCQWCELRNRKIMISSWIKNMGWKRIAIYGMGEMGKLLKKELQLDGVKVLYAIDRNAENIKTDIPVYDLSNGLEEVDGVIVTAITFYTEIVREISTFIEAPVVSLKDILDEIECTKLGTTNFVCVR